jgi:membrane-associated protease RseP (regulator of RpoE activity)
MSSTGTDTATTPGAARADDRTDDRTAPVARPAGAEVEILRRDPAPVRWLVAWRRSGRAEGRRSEFHPLRAAGLGAAVVALAVFLPGAAVFLGMLVGLIVVHEAAHYVVARRSGMRPVEFFVGFGPTVWSGRTSTGLRYGVKLLPAGGYVKIPGMSPTEEVESSLEPFTYRAASRGRRLAVILAGPLSNLVLAVVLFALYAITSPTIDATPSGVLFGSLDLLWDVTAGTLQSLFHLVTGAGDYATSVAGGQAPDQRMLSVVGGAQVTEQLLAGEQGKLLVMAGLFSASVGVLNLLPVLPLDGGHAVVVLAEGALARIRRRPTLRLDTRRLQPIALAVVATFLLLGVSSMWVDVLHPVSIGG